MKKIAYLVVLFMILTGFTLAACGGGSSGAGETPEETDVPVPTEYAGKTNPHANDAAAAATGKTIYDQNCASCHGEDGKGDGAAGASLNPKPADLTELSEDTDDRIFWRISEGGGMAPFNSAMPAWKGTLSEDQIWDLVTYIRTLK